MFRKTVLAALAVAVIATSALSVSNTQASAGNGGAVAAGAIIGLAAGAMIGAAANDRYYDRRYDDRRYYRPHRRECWDKPVRRWDPYYQRRVIVGYRTVCR